MATITYSTDLINEIGAKYKSDNLDFSGTDEEAAKQWNRDAIKSYLQSARVNSVNTDAHKTASDAANEANAAREAAWADLDAAKATALTALDSELGSGIS